MVFLRGGDWGERFGFVALETDSTLDLAQKRVEVVSGRR